MAAKSHHKSKSRINHDHNVISSGDHKIRRSREIALGKNVGMTNNRSRFELRHLPTNPNKECRIPL